MNKASINSLRAGVIAAGVLMMAACSMAPVKQSGTAEPTTAATNATPAQQPEPKKVVEVKARKDILPQQKYAMDGSKIPYVAMPNPYLADRVEVPPAALSQYNKAVAYLKQGKLKEARKEFKSLTRNYKDLSGPWARIAEIAIQREEYSDAITAYEKALAINPNNMPVYLDLANLYRDQGRFDEARNTYLRALNIWPDFPEGHHNLAVFYDLYMNKPLEAQKHFQAYYFLTGDKSETVRKWLVELQRRTGDDQNYVDTAPPKKDIDQSSSVVAADKS